MSLPSEKVRTGVEAAPQRSLFYALGLTEEEAEEKIIRGFLS